MSQTGERTLAPVRTVGFGPDTERRYASDRAHQGDIHGALGRVSSFDTGPRRTLRRRLVTLLAIAGPGLVVMLADNDAGGISLYAQAGKAYGLPILGVLGVLAVVLYVNQEMVSRVGAVTGVGHARLIAERFGRRWGSFALTDLLLLNLLTLVIDFVGVRFSLASLGVSRFLSVPLAAAFLVAAVVSGSFRRWERLMYCCIAASLVALPFLLLSGGHHDPQGVATLLRTGNHSSSGLLFAIALVGTTVAPWQLFLQQSSVVDKRITPRWLSYERVDVAIGTFLFVCCTVAILLAFALTFHGSPLAGSTSNAAMLGHDLRILDGPIEATLFAVLLLNGSILGAMAVTLATSYAVGDYFGVRHSLHRDWRQAPVFHATFAASVLVAGGVVLLPGLPLGLLTVSVQALSGTLLPSATVLLLLLCNDRHVLGPHTNSTWLNGVATVVVGAMLVLSGVVSATTLFPGLHILPTVIAFGLLVTLGLLALAVGAARRSQAAVAVEGDRLTWTMPPLELLPKPQISRARQAGLTLLRSYLLLATVLLAVKIVHLAFAAA